MSFQMAKQSMWEARSSDAPKPCSSPSKSVRRCPGSTRLLINQFLNVMWTLEKICTLTSWWAVEQPCSPASQKDWANKWLPSPPQPWKSRCWLLRKESSWSGSVDQFCPPSQLSRPCGSPEPNFTNLDPQSCTENASDLYNEICLV